MLNNVKENVSVTIKKRCKKASNGTTRNKKDNG